MHRSPLLFILLAGFALPLAAGEAEADGSWFAITPDHAHAEIFDAYEAHRQANRPLFISTDLALHAGHLLFDYSLRVIELDRLYARAVALTEAMLTAAGPRPGPDPLAEERKNLLAYFSVAARCLDPGHRVHPTVAAQVEQELAWMEAHQGFELSTCPHHHEDFSQYVPRGHYTRNETFRRYFKAMMWYGRRLFRVEEVRPRLIPPAFDPWDEAHLLRETRQMLLITGWLRAARIDDRAALETWRALYEPTALFAGRTEDLNPLEVIDLAGQVWPNGYPADDDLANAEKIKEFAAKARAFSKPKIDSSGTGRKGFGFMPQRFTPDSYITQCLVTDADVRFGDGVPAHPLPYTGQREPKPFTWGINRDLSPSERRFMPRGLDVMAVFGSTEALAILAADGDTAYAGYDEMLAFLRRDVGELMEKHRGANLYYGWLHALLPLLAPRDDPDLAECFRGRGWTRKQLATALASWAELRHDTILYVKQSYTPAPRCVPPPIAVQDAYVEPAPETFAHIGAMVARMRRDLAALGVLPEVLDRRYIAYVEACERLAGIARRELDGRRPTPEELAFLHGVAGALRDATTLPPELKQQVASETDARMAIIADVHTDTNDEEALQQGVGDPFLLQVHLPAFADHPATTYHGAVFSYYEFKQPIADRLTDEAWQERLADPARRPELPGWYPASAGDPADPQPAEERP